MRKTVIPFALLVLPALTAFGAQTDAPPQPEKPWRPFSQLPEVLWYEDFETDKKLFEKGQLKSGEPCLPNNQAAEAVKADGSNAFIVIKLNSTPLKAPNGLEPEHLFLSLNFWSDETGDINFKVSHSKGDYSTDVRVPKEKTWVPILVRLGDLHNKNAHPEPTDVWSKLEIKLKPRGGRTPIFYVDDLIMTYKVKPAEVLPKVLFLRKAVTDMTRIASKDGYTFVSPDALKSELKTTTAKKKAKTVLVFGSTQAESDEFVKSLTEAAPKAKLSGYSFVAATSPDSSPVGGLDDERALLAWNLHKSEAETVLFIFGPDDAHEAKSRVGRVLNALFARTFTLGALPVVCLSPVPADKEGKTKVEMFNGSVLDICKIFSMTYVDPAAVKNSTPAGITVEALKHIDTYVYARK